MSLVKIQGNASGTGEFTYLHCKPDGVPFYVGKGSIKRSKKLYDRNKYHENIVTKYGKENILIGRIECSSENIAFDLERGIIKCLRRSGIKLTNFTEGGIGGVCGKPSWNKGKKFTEEHRAKLSIARMGKAPPNKGNLVLLSCV
jgi:hypothetical protein